MRGSPVDSGPVPPSTGIENSIWPPEEPTAGVVTVTPLPAGALAETNTGAGSPPGPAAGNVSMRRTFSAVEALLFETVMV